MKLAGAEEVFVKSAIIDCLTDRQMTVSFDWIEKNDITALNVIIERLESIRADDVTDQDRQQFKEKGYNFRYQFTDNKLIISVMDSHEVKPVIRDKYSRLDREYLVKFIVALDLLK